MEIPYKEKLKCARDSMARIETNILEYAKNDAARYLLDAGVGLRMLDGVFELKDFMADNGNYIAPKVQELIGPYGAAAVEYGFPALGLFAGGTLMFIALKGTNEYLKGNKGIRKR